VQLDFFLGNLNDLGLTIQVYSRGPGVYINGAVGDVTLNASDAKLAEQKSKPHQWKFLNTAHQTQSMAMTAGNIYPIQLLLLNGLVPFAWFIMRQSTTRAGLTTGTQLTNFEWRNSQIQVYRMEFLPGTQLLDMSMVQGNLTQYSSRTILCI